MTQRRKAWEIGNGGNAIFSNSKFNARYRVAEVTVVSPIDGVDWQENARLIANAPEMLNLIETVADLNPNMIEIGEGKLRTLVADAQLLIDRIINNKGGF